MLKPVKVGLLGGTGAEGRGLALRFAAAGQAVGIGSRDPEKARQAALAIGGLLEGRAGSVAPVGAGNEELAEASEFLFITVPFDHAVQVLESCRGSLRPEMVVVDSSVPLVFETGRVGLRELPEGSGSAHLAARLPGGIELVAAFKTIPARVLADLDTPLDCDLFVCGGSQQARARVLELTGRIDGLRPLDAGGLETASTLERLCALAVMLNRRYRAHSSRFRVVGI